MKIKYIFIFLFLFSTLLPAAILHAAEENISINGNDITFSPDESQIIQGSMTVITAVLKNSGGNANTTALHNDYGYDNASYDVNNTVNVSGLNRVAQSFYVTPGAASFTISKISLYCFSSSPNGVLKVDLRADNQGKPGAVLETKTIPTPIDGSVAWRDATGFSTTINPGNTTDAPIQYWIVAYTSDGSVSWNVAFDPNNLFQRGQVARLLGDPDTATNWYTTAPIHLTTDDLLFRITGTPPILVQFYDGLPSANVQISSNCILTNLPSGSPRSTSVIWRAHPGGIHDIYVRAIYAGIDTIALGHAAPNISLSGPSNITDLIATTYVSGSNADQGSINLKWTAPGEDLKKGSPTGYDLRYSSNNAITDQTSFLASPQYKRNTQQGLYNGHYKSNISTNSIYGGNFQTLTITGLVFGATYWFALEAMDCDAPIHWSDWSVGGAGGYNLKSSTTSLDLKPPTPTGLKVEAGYWQISSSWTAPAADPTFTDFYTYRVYYDSTTTDFSRPSTGTETTSTHIIFKNINQFTTYYFRVTTIDTGPLFLRSVFQTAVSTSSNPPFAPQGFTGYHIFESPPFEPLVRSTSTIGWYWKDRAINEMGFNIRDQNNALKKNLPVNTTFWIEPFLTANTAYQRCIEAYNIYGTSPSVHVTTTTYTLANPPVLTRYFPGVSSTTISLSWNRNNNPIGTTRYGIIRSTGPDHWTSTDTVKAYSHAFTSTSFIDKGLTTYTTYWYKICAYNGDKIPSRFVNVFDTDGVKISTVTNPGVPKAPDPFGGVALSTGSIHWTWVDNSSGTSPEFGFKVMKVSPGGADKILSANVTYWSEPSLNLNMPYRRQVKAWNVTGYNLSVSSLIYTLANPPTKSFFLSVGSNSVTLTWNNNKNPDTNTSLGIVRCYHDNTFDPLYTSTLTVFGVLTAPTTIYVDTGLDLGPDGLQTMTEYWYKIKSFNGNGIGTVPDHIIKVKTKPAPPKRPNPFGGVALSTGSIHWVWKDNSDIANNPKDRELKFEIRQDPHPGSLKGTVLQNVTWFNEPNLGTTPNGTTPNIQFNRYVGAFNETSIFGVSSCPYSISNSSAIYTLANPPKLTKIATDPLTGRLKVWSSSVTIQWDTNGNPPTKTYWGIIRSTGPDFFKSTDKVVRSYVDRMNGTPTPFIDTGLDPDTSYWWKICAYNGDGVATVYDSTWTKTNDAPPHAPDFDGFALSTGSIRWTIVDRSNNEQHFWIDGTANHNRLFPVAPGFARVPGKWVSGSIEGHKIELIEVSTVSHPNAGFDRCAEASNSIGSNFSPQATHYYTLANPTTFAYTLSVTSFSVRMAWERNLNPVYTRWGVRRSTNRELFTSSITVAGFGDQLKAFSDASKLVSFNDLYNDPRDKNAKNEIGSNNLLPSTTYWYKVFAYNGNARETVSTGTYNSFFNNVVRSTMTNPAPPPSPQAFDGIAKSTTSIFWVWADSPSLPSPAAKDFKGDSIWKGVNFRVKASSPNVTVSPPPFLPQGTTTWLEVDNLSINTQYSRYCESFNVTASSASNTRLRYTLANPPTGNYIIDVIPLQIKLGWRANNNPDYTYYGLLRSSDNFHLSTTTILNFGNTYYFTTYTDPPLIGKGKDLVPDTTYWYKVCAFNGDGIRTDYNTAIATMTRPGQPARPTKFNGVAVSSTSIKWFWKKTAYADGYYISNSSYVDKANNLTKKWVTLKSNGIPIKVRNLGNNTTFCFENDLTYNTSYYRYVVAFNITGSSPSIGAVRFTLANPPDPLKTSVSSPTWHTNILTWNTDCATRLAVDISTASNFSINRSSLTWDSEISSSPFTIKHLYLNSTYYFGLWGYNYEGAISSTKTVVKGFTKDLPFDIKKIYPLPNLGGNQTWYATINNAPVMMEADMTPSPASVPVYVIITPDAIHNPQLVDKETLDFANSGIILEPNRHVFEPGAVEFNMYDFYGSTVEWNAGAHAKIILSYPDVNNDRIVDDVSTQYEVEKLLMLYLDPLTKSWADVPEATKDTVKRTLSVDVLHMSMYSIGSHGPLGGFYARVYPNPFKPNSGIGHTVITFTGLQQDSTLRIYTMAGQLVYKVENILTSSLQWNGTNQYGRKLASGVYIYVLSDRTGATIKDRLAIIR